MTITKPKQIRFALARNIAELLWPALSAACDRVEVVGSLRRERNFCKDIEFVVVPKRERDLFGGKGESRLDAKINAMRTGGVFRQPGVPCNGQRHKRFAVWYRVVEGTGPVIVTDSIDTDCQSVNVELFITNKQNFGYQMAIRTGPAELSKMLVTQRSKGGVLENDFQCKGGEVWAVSTLEKMYLPEEADFFAITRLSKVWEPRQRDELARRLTGGGGLDRNWRHINNI